MQREFLEGLSDQALRALPYLFDFWALPHQLPPEDAGDWKTWVVLGGRGAGKTRAGAEWVRSMVEGSGPTDEGRARRVALVGETFDQARDVMVFGESGILACTPPDRTPVWESGRRRLVWPNGAEAKLFSAHDYEGLRGPQFDAAWLDELGCAAVDKGTNEPNRFLDPKSSESSLPKHSTGARDDLIQMQYLRAMSEFWSDAGNNPVSDLYGASMIDTERMFFWAWDARPYPWFPANSEVWGDGENYARGHWLNGRVTSRTLDGVIREICAAQGVEDVDVSNVRSLVRGYAIEGGASAREALQPLLLAHGVDAVEREGQVVFRTRDGQVGKTLDTALFARDEAEPVLSRARLADAEVSGRVRLTYVEADGDYEARATEGIFPDEVTAGISRSELPLVLTGGEAQSVVDRWLAEARVAREGATFSLPPSSDVRAGDVVTVDGSDYRVDRLEEAGARQVEAVRVERGLYRPFVEADNFIPPRPHVPPLPVWAEMMDLPILRADAVPDAPWVAAVSEPWPGEVAVYSSIDGERWSFEAGLSRRAVMGVTLNDLPAARAGLWDRGPDLNVRLAYGTLASVDDMALFAGGNVGVIGSAESLDREVFQFQEADLTAPDTWTLAQRLRGLRGTEGIMPAIWPAGSTVVVLDAALRQVVLPSEARGLEWHYRVGPATKPVDHASYVGFTHVARGVALRPYAPVHLRMADDGGGDHLFTWIRQTRIDGDNWTLAEVPLGEASERYRVEVWSAGTLRRAAATGAPVFNYGAAGRVTDGVTGPYEVRVAQLSDLYGPGLETRININD